jgi:hypothetical protein
MRATNQEEIMSSDIDPNVGNEKSTAVQRIAERLVAMLPPDRRKRVNLVLSERHIDRLERLVRLTDASSIAEVVREALFVYEILVEKLLMGSSLKELTSKGELFPMELGIDVHRPLLLQTSRNAGESEMDHRQKPKRKVASR